MFNHVLELKEYAKELQVLFVEDNDEARMFMSELLSRFFKSVQTANNGLEGLSLYNKNDYDIVITDINMPEMNGIEMVEKIREINAEQKIIAVSAHNESNILMELVKAGFNSFALKPIEPNLFFKTLYPVVRDAYTQKLNEELVLQLNSEREKLKRQVKELLSLSRTVETKHQQVEQLLRAQEISIASNTGSTVDEYFKPDENINENIVFLSDHSSDLMEMFNEIPDLLNFYIQEHDDKSLQKIIVLLSRSVSIMLYYTPYIDIIAESLNDLITALQEKQDDFRAICSTNPDDILRLFDAVSSDIERYVTRFSIESLAMHNIHHIHKPTALSIIQIVQLVAPKEEECEEIEFF